MAGGIVITGSDGGRDGDETAIGRKCARHQGKLQLQWGQTRAWWAYAGRMGRSHMSGQCQSCQYARSLQIRRLQNVFEVSLQPAASSLRICASLLVEKPWHVQMQQVGARRADAKGLGMPRCTRRKMNTK